MNPLERAQRRVEQLEKLTNDINALKAQAEKLIEDFLPAHYKDGDVRHVPLAVYRKIRVLIEQVTELEDTLYKRGVSVRNFPGERTLSWRGQFGELKIQPAPEPES